MKYEHKTFVMAEPAQHRNEKLKKISSEGWELVAVVVDQHSFAHDHIAYFKRPL